jgi:uncharacterized damage-inducible protein DinB
MRPTAADPLAGQILEAWRINNRINLFLIDRIDDDGWHSTMSTRGGRDVARQFAHLHDVRLSWLEVSAKDLGSGLKKFAAKASPSKAAVPAALEASGAAIERLVERGLENGGVLKGFKRGVVPALAYLIAHDSHHRGSVLLTLKLSDHKVDTATQYGIWEWDKR